MNQYDFELNSKRCILEVDGEEINVHKGETAAVRFILSDEVSLSERGEAIMETGLNEEKIIKDAVWF